jgi:hypothetical protein
MTVYGPGCTSREPVTIINNPPRQYSDLETEYFAQREVMREMWLMHDAKIESHLDQDMIDESFDACKRQEKAVLSLKKQVQCKHEMSPIGKQFFGGGFIDNEDDICNLCGVLGRKLIKKSINYYGGVK